MPQLSKKTKNFLIGEGIKPDSDSDIKKVLRPCPASASRMVPGDILVFRYYLGTGEGSRAQKVVLIVSCGRGPGSFPGREGTLVSCIKLEILSEVVVDVLVTNLYNKRKVASRDKVIEYLAKVKDSIAKLTGSTGDFRTYKLNKMKAIFKVFLGDDR